MSGSGLPWLERGSFGHKEANFQRVFARDFHLREIFNDLVILREENPNIHWTMFSFLPGDEKRKCKSDSRFGVGPLFWTRRPRDRADSSVAIAVRMKGWVFGNLRIYVL